VRPLLDATARRFFLALGVGGAVAFVAGALGDAPRAFASMLTAGYFLVSLSLGAALFLATNHLGAGGWMAAFKRVPEAIAASLPAGALGVLVVLAGLPVLYPWARGHGSAWLSPAPFAARMVIVFGIWLAFVALLRRTSLQQDRSAEVRLTARSVALSAGFLAVFSLTFTIASFDWLMSLEGHWASTIYGLYNMGGALCGGVAAIALVAVLLKRAGRLPDLTESHLHDLGKLMFAFSTLWAYLWLSQYLLIWYANLSEEIPYYLARTSGGWQFLFWANIVLGWGLPFMMLLTRASKRSEGGIVRAALVLLLARWLDVYLMVAPSSQPVHPGIGLVEAGAALGGVGAFALLVAWHLRRAPLVAAGDPYLRESLHYRSF
jgi:hypothetical protein